MEEHGRIMGNAFARMSSMPFLNMTQIRQIMSARGMMISDMIQLNEKEQAPSDYYDMSENIEDESYINYPPRNVQVQEEDGNDKEDNEIFGISGESFIYTMVYLIGFSITLLYMGIKLVRRWRGRNNRRNRLSDIEGVETGSLPPCGHPQCARRGGANPTTPVHLPYTGLAGAWVPEMFSLHRRGAVSDVTHSVVHSTLTCRGCTQCSALSRPPPSYTKLFLEEQPPSYIDAVCLEDTVVHVTGDKVEETSDLIADTVSAEVRADEQSEEVQILPVFGDVENIDNNSRDFPGTTTKKTLS